MTDLLSFLGMFSYGLGLVFIGLLVLLGGFLLIYVFSCYLIPYLFLIPIGLLKKDKYFVVGLFYDFLNPHIWEGRITEYKELILYQKLLDFYGFLTIFNVLIGLVASYFTKNIFHSLFLVILGIYCFYKSGKAKEKYDIAKDNLNKYYESLSKNWRSK